MKKVILTFLLFGCLGVAKAQTPAEQITKALQDVDAQKLKQLFDSGIDANTKDVNGSSLVGGAVLYPELLKLFIDKGANIDDPGPADYPPILSAITMTAPESVKMLIDAGANVNFKQKSTGLTLLHYATWRSNCAECVKMLIDAGVDVNAKSNDGETAATIMATAMTPWQRVEANYHTVKMMKTFGYEKLPERFMNPKIEDWDSPSEIMEILLNAGLDPKISNKQGTTPLMMAAYYNNVPLMKKLIEGGASLKDKDKLKKTTLEYAVDGGAGEALMFLIEEKMIKVDEKLTWDNPFTKIKMEGVTPLAFAAGSGSPETIKKLIDLGASPHSTSSGNFINSHGCMGVVKGKTPLVYAIESGKLENVKAIIENADKNKLLQDWVKYDLKPTTLQQLSYTKCTDPWEGWRAWNYAEKLGYEHIAEYMKEAFAKYTVGK